MRKLIVALVLILCVLVVPSLAASMTSGVTYVNDLDYYYYAKVSVPMQSAVTLKVTRMYGLYIPDWAHRVLDDGWSGNLNCTGNHTHPQLSETCTFYTPLIDEPWEGIRVHFIAPGPLVPNCANTRVKVEAWYTPAGGSETFLGTQYTDIPPCY